MSGVNGHHEAKQQSTELTGCFQSPKLNYHNQKRQIETILHLGNNAINVEASKNIYQFNNDSINSMSNPNNIISQLGIDSCDENKQSTTNIPLQKFDLQNGQNGSGFGAKKRRHLLNSQENGLSGLQYKRESTIESIQFIEDDKKSYARSSQHIEDSSFQVNNIVSGTNKQKQNEELTSFPNLIENQPRITSERLIYQADKKLSIEELANQMTSKIGFSSSERIIGNGQKESAKLSPVTLKHPRFTVLHDSLFGNSDHAYDSPRSDSIKSEVRFNYSTLILAKRFVNRLKKSVTLNIFSSLKTPQFKLINDLAYFEEGQQKQNKEPQMRQKEKEQLRFQASERRMKGLGFLFIDRLKNMVVSSESIICMVIEILVIIAVFVQIYIIPLRICFNTWEEQNHTEPIFRTITMVTLPIFFAEIIFKCLSSYYEEGVEVKEQSKIMKNYFQTSFLGDVLTFSALSVSLQFDNEWSTIIFLIRLNRLPSLIANLDNHLQLEHRFPTAFQLFKLMLLIVTIGHYCGCGFNYLGQYQNRRQENNWLRYKKIDDDAWDTQYLYGLYFSFITMITVGYGDITPQTNKEIIYVLFMTLISTGTFAYSINTIGSIFREVQLKKQELKRQKHEVQYYLANRNISKSIQVKALKELEHVQIRQSQGGQKGELILQTLSLDIRNSIKKEYFGRILDKYKLLKLNFSQAFIEKLSLKLKEVVLAPDEVILQQGETQNKVFCLVTGELIVFQSYANNRLEHYNIGRVKKGEFSDQTGLFLDCTSDYGLKSVGISQLVYFSSEDFVSTLKTFPQEFETFCMLRDNIIFQKKYIDLKCHCCGQFSHSTNTCKSVHYVADSEMLVRKMNTAQISYSRIPYCRTQEKFKTKTRRLLTSESLKRFRLNQINSIIPQYTPAFGITFQTNDEDFLSFIPEISCENGQIYVNFDEEEEDDEEVVEGKEPILDGDEYLEGKDNENKKIYGFDVVLAKQQKQYQQQQQQQQQQQGNQIHNDQSPVILFGNGNDHNVQQKRQSIYQLDESIQLNRTFSIKQPNIQMQDSFQANGNTLNFNSNIAIQSQLQNTDIEGAAVHSDFSNSLSDKNIVVKPEGRRSLIKEPSVLEVPSPYRRNSPKGGVSWISPFSALTQQNQNGISTTINQIHSLTAQNNFRSQLSLDEIQSPFADKHKHLSQILCIQENGSIGGSIKQRTNNSSGNVFNDQASSKNGKRKINIYNQIGLSNYNPGNFNQSTSNYHGGGVNSSITSMTAAFHNGIEPNQHKNSIYQEQKGFVGQIQIPFSQSGNSMNSIGEVFSPEAKRSENSRHRFSLNPVKMKNSSVENSKHRLQVITQRNFNGTNYSTNSPLVNMRVSSGAGMNGGQLHLFQNKLGQFGGNNGQTPQNLLYLQQYLSHHAPQTLHQFINGQANENLQLIDFPHSNFDSLKNYKQYFAHGNIESIKQSYSKYQLNRIRLNKDLRLQFKKKLIKQAKQTIADLPGVQTTHFFLKQSFGPERPSVNRKKQGSTKVFNKPISELSKFNFSNKTLSLIKQQSKN